MKSNVWKRFVSAGLIGVMAAGLLAGCGGGGDAQTGGGGDTQAAGGSSGGGGVTLTDPGTYPIVEGGELELSMFTMSMPNVEDFATNDFTKFMEEKTGITMSFYTGGRDEWEEKLNMILQGDDYPDIIFGVSPNIAKYGVKEGIFICEIPTTTDEFIDVCKKFLEMKPDGIAVAGADVGWYTRMQDWLLGAYTFIPSKSNTFIVRDCVALDSDTGNVVCVATSDEYKEGLRFINELYQMGAIYDGDFTQTAEQMKTLVNQADEPVGCD